LDDPHVVGPASSPVSDPHQISSDPEPDEDDWDRQPLALGKETSLELGAIDWSEINAEVDEFLNETDDDEEARSDGSVTRENVSEDEGGDGMNSTTR
jgi:RNA polymerase II subunit A-like phosphatase